MSLHPVSQIIQSFSPSLQKAYVKTLVEGTRSKKIFTTLVQFPELDREKLFKKIFKKPYTREDDYLLRNELSLLRRKMENFLVTEQEMKEPESVQPYKIYLLAKCFMDRQLFDLAREKAEKARAMALENEDWPLLVQLNLLQNSIDQIDTVELKERIENIEQRIIDHKHFALQFKEAEFAFAHYMQGMKIKIQSIGENPPPDIITRQPLREKHTESEAYFYYKGLAYALGGADSVPLLEQALYHIEKLPRTISRIGEWFSCVGQIASELSAAGDFGPAEKYFNRIIASPDLEKYAKKNFLVLNYIVTLVKLKKYREALKWILPLEKTSQEQYVIERLRVAKISCYLFLKDTQNLKRSLPKDFSNVDIDVRHYYRMQYSIYFYISGDIETAEREMLNLQRAAQAQQMPYKILIDLLLVFYAYRMSWPRNDAPAERRKKVTRAFTVFNTSARPEVKNMVPALWLMEEWEEIKKQAI